jgi:hypothetical protein
MQLELGKQLTSRLEVPSEVSPDLSSLLLRMKQADQTAEQPQ